MKSIGIDAVEVKRFTHWHIYSQQALLHIFTPAEIKYCLAIPVKSAERFAVRFAAKEAVYKALSTGVLTTPISFMRLAKYIEIVFNSCGMPGIHLHQQHIHTFGLNNIVDEQIMLSLTHIETTAIAVVLLN